MAETEERERESARASERASERESERERERSNARHFVCLFVGKDAKTLPSPSPSCQTLLTPGHMRATPTFIDLQTP